ncbi:damage-control phosphatase ARMT1 family protein [Caldisalinibacter kiritimatiensis]|uniref:Damage-control phosphatase ARMT1-like metal-binding domain-containing protein n=1 Tax=Caldisalinibacter kiritimatiensis TaxID=1304284 RepID=R1CFI1_9FIRM|nr:ARMT1-like domain-containing protein [Caldisalinibacter kiritimatiensis]EOD01055.1 hypothetical protein L21TH_0881 [Caldisalinibacter kiritimatiensis]
MNIYLECLPCFLRQVLEASKLATENQEIQKRIMKDAAKVITDFENYRYAPEVGRVMHSLVKEYTNTDDPYVNIKQENIDGAKEVYPYLKNFLHKKEDRIYWALKISAVGNVMDAAIYKNIDIKKAVENELDEEFNICHIKELKERLKEAKSILIIGDNSGETVFDKVLIEELLDFNIVYAVRSEPIINDATLKEAKDSGLDINTKLITTGCNAPGTIIEECSDEFKEIYENADIVISKGQGNYETLSEQDREIFFLLKAKCPVIATDIGVNVNDYILLRNI